MSRQSRFVREEWVKVMDKFAPLLCRAIDLFQDSGNQLPLLHAVLHLISLPSISLVNITGLSPPSGIVHIEDGEGNFTMGLSLGNKPKSDGKWRPQYDNIDLSGNDLSTLLGEASHEIHSAVRALYADKQSTATKILTSNGTAPRNRATAAIMRSMHLDRVDSLDQRDTVCPQLSVAPLDCWNQLAKEAGDKNASCGPFGWAPSLFYFQRGLTGHKRTSSLMWQVARLQALVGSATIPNAVAFLLVTGSLTALNKEPPDIREHRRRNGEPPKLRPINSGSTLAKTALRCAVKHPSGLRAGVRLRPFQYGDGAPGGPEQVVHVLRRLAHSGR